MKWLSVLFLALGVVVGAAGTSFISTHPLYKMNTFIGWQLAVAAVEDASIEEYDALPDDLNREQLDEYGLEASTTLFNLTPASATSSSRSVQIPILIYHSIRPHIKGESKLQDEYDVTPELFEQELAYIHENNFHPISFAELNAYFEGNSLLPEKPVILTFDDGWKNQYKYAFPLLEKYGIKATFFIYSNPIDHNKAHWMSWDEVRALDRAGMEIGGHSRTHPVLVKMTDNAKLEWEIAGGKKIIEDELGHAIQVFAYPFGSDNPEVQKTVINAGYKMARIIAHGKWNDPAHRYQITGVISGDSWKTFVEDLSL